MLLRQEASLDQSIDRKVRILLRLRRELANLPLAPPREDDGAGKETIEEIPDENIMPENLQGVETAEASKMSELCGNVLENKRSGKKAELGTVNCELRKVGGIS